LDSTCDCLINVAQVAGPNFEPCLAALWKILLKYYSQSEDHKVTIVGLLAEVTKAMKQQAIPYTKQLFEIAYQGMTSSETQLQRNSAFLCGLLCESTKEHAFPYYGDTITRLLPLFGSDDGTVRDNVCGALARMICTQMEAVPLEHILPLMLRAMPLTSDKQENPAVYSAIFLLFQANHLVLGKPGIMAGVIKVLSEALGDDELEDWIRQGTRSLLTTLVSKYPQEMQQIVASLPHELQRNLALLMQ